jgi:hypothetical protein
LQNLNEITKRDYLTTICAWAAMTFSLTTLGVIVKSLTLGIATFNTKALSIATLSIMALKLKVMILIVFYFYYLAEYRYVECHCANCHGTNCRLLPFFMFMASIIS